MPADRDDKRQAANLRKSTFNRFGSELPRSEAFVRLVALANGDPVILSNSMSKVPNVYYLFGLWYCAFIHNTTPATSFDPGIHVVALFISTYIHKLLTHMFSESRSVSYAIGYVAHSIDVYMNKKSR